MSLVMSACLLVPLSTLANVQASATAIPFSFFSSASEVFLNASKSS